MEWDKILNDWVVLVVGRTGSRQSDHGLGALTTVLTAYATGCA